MNARFALCLVAFLGLTASAFALTVDGITVKGLMPATAKEMVHIKSVSFARGVSVEGAAKVLVVSGVLVSRVGATAAHQISVTLKFEVGSVDPGSEWLKGTPVTITVDKVACGADTPFSGVVDAPAYNEKFPIGYAVAVEVKPYESPRLRK